MAKYTYADIIIDPNDERIEIGKEYYSHDIPIDTLKEANDDSDTEILTDVIIDSTRPFQMDNNEIIFSCACIIRKKESKYVPFDLSKEEDRAKLRGAWIKFKYNPEYEYEIYGVDTYGVYAYADYYTPDYLLENCLFVDGTPCGKLMEGEEE